MAEEIVFNRLVRKLSPTIKRIAYRLNGRYRSLTMTTSTRNLCSTFGMISTAASSRTRRIVYILQGCYFHLKNCIRKINERPNVVSLESLIEDHQGANLEDSVFSRHMDQPDLREQADVKLTAGAIQNNGFSPREKKIISFLAEGLTTREIGGRVGLSHVGVVKAVKKIRKKSFRHLDNF
jgi:DNA-directed RNA polymerase specialized sigma subunit